MTAGRTLYLDGSAGVSGNMFLGACLDLGLPLSELRDLLARLSIPPFEIRAETVYKGGVRATFCEVHPSESRDEGNLRDFTDAIARSPFPQSQKERGIRLFRRLAEVEGRIHGKPPEAVHFHELGGWDTLVDVMGTIVALDRLGVEELVVGPLHVGRGWAHTSHGKVPVPAPATAELLKGFAVYTTEVEGELVTPTGALIVSTLGISGSQPPMMVEGIGYGAGTLDLPIPNTLRAFLGHRVSPGDAADSFPGKEGPGYPPGKMEGPGYPPGKMEQVAVLECNLDDMNPEWHDHVMERLYGAGAREVFLTPAQMKKNRPGVLLTVLAPIGREEELLGILFRESSTLGVRCRQSSRRVLERRTVSVSTPWGSVRIKEGIWEREVVNASPEYDDLKALARENCVPLKQVHEDALAAYRALTLVPH